MATEAKAPSINKNTVAKKPASTKDLIQVMLPEIKKALPNTLTPERFTRMATTALSSNPQLQKCSQVSFIGAMMNAAQLGLEPNTPLGQAYLIPYSNKGSLECQFQIGYMGYLQLAHNAGVNVTAHEVCENDEFDYSYGLEEMLVHKPAKENRGKVTHYYATWRLGETKVCGFAVMTKEEVEEHGRKYSKSYSSSYSPWKTNFDAMAKKTVIKQALKFAPLSTELRTNLAEDETIKTEVSKDMSEVQDKTVWDIVDVDTTENDVVDNGNDPTTNESEVVE